MTMLHHIPAIPELYSRAADAVVAAGLKALRQRGRFVLALAGGSTPRNLYNTLAAPRFASHLDWSKVEIFFGDERTVGPEHPDSNFRMARETLLEPLGLSGFHVHRIWGEKDPSQAAAHYEEEIANCFSIATSDAPPAFDLILLGMGDDGHTASLFPHTKALEVRDRWVVANEVPQQNTTRITFTFPLINSAHAVMFLVVGRGKAPALKRVLHGPHKVSELPSQGVAPTSGTLDWYVDSAAASELSSNF